MLKNQHFSPKLGCRIVTRCYKQRGKWLTSSDIFCDFSVHIKYIKKVKITSILGGRVVIIY